jgi:hypothetical protein
VFLGGSRPVWRAALRCLGGALGAAAAFLLVHALRPLLPAPAGGVGFATVHRVAKSADLLRFLLLLVFVPAGAALAGAPGDAGPRPEQAEQERETKGARPVPWKAIVLLGLLVAAVRVATSGGIDGPIELFHPAEHLVPASEHLAGKAFYRETVPFHGLFADGLLEAAAFRRFGETLSVSRWLAIVLDAVFFFAAVLAFALVLRRPGAALLGVVLLSMLAGAWVLGAGFPLYRTLPLLLSAALAARSARSGRPSLLVPAGACAGFGIFWSLETGVFAAAGLAAWLVLDSFAGPREHGRWRAAAAGLALGILPPALSLAGQGVLVDFSKTSILIARSADAVWGLPAPGGRELLAALAGGPFGFLKSEALHFHLPIVFLGGVAAALLLRARAGRFGARDRELLALLVFSAVGFRSALGRSSYSHTRFSLVVPSLLIAALLAPAASGLRRRRLSGKGLAAILLLVAAFAVYAEVPASASATVRNFGRLLRSGAGDGLAPLALARAGSVRIAPEEASGLVELRLFADSHCGPGRTFFDFANAGALYFLLARPDPTRFVQPAFLSADGLEKEAIAALRKRPPCFVVTGSPQGQESFDGISNSRRCPRLAAWIESEFPLSKTVAGFSIRLPGEGKHP